ncbi:hypothetical protein CDL15_Pgr013455 [Punica granatum]|uniref:Uncharacterized protein n=1 Tax=Punica granatum TaxID=22663 RepID=A0A218W192_PUNGR|nr:hypothetical protein CDL15_Pgr013455 [Punica granatum]
MDEINTEAPTVMLGGYVNNGDIEKSLSLFKVLPIKDVTSWTTIIHGLMQNGQERTALELLFEKKLGQIFDEVTFSIALRVHAYTEKVGHNLDVPLRSLIIDMYCKCESLGDATLIFEGGKDTRVALWTSMISGLPANGRGKEAVNLFNLMINEGINQTK